VDQELKAYLDERFGRLEERMEARFGSVDAQFGSVDARFSSMDAQFSSLDARFSSLDARFEQLETSVRHTQVTVEAMRGDIRLIAEGVMGISERQEAFQAETARRFEEVKGMLSPYYKDLGGRAQSLENDVQCLDERVRVLENKADRQTRDVLDTIRQKFGKPQA
jgi:chromosome segregation ATPase